MDPAIQERLDAYLDRKKLRRTPQRQEIVEEIFSSEEHFTADELIRAQQLLRRMPVGESVVEQILDLVRACRPDDPSASTRVRETVNWGPGPRAAQALMMTVRARAMLNGRLAPSTEDVVAMARPVLSHRMGLNFAARARGDSLAALIEETAATVTGTEAAA